MADLGISFARQVKEESARQERSDEEKRSLLSSFIRLNGYLQLTGGKEGLELSSESANVAKVIFKYLHDLYGVTVRFAYTRSAGFLKRIVYHIIVDEGAADILSDVEVDFFAPVSPKHVLATPEQVAAYLCGAFLAGGSVNSPLSSNYHLEIALADEGYARFLSREWNKAAFHQFESKLIKRRKQYVVYLKKSDQISDFLILIGAKESCLHFENVRVDRDFANIDNRLQNLDTANYGKTRKAGERQCLQIRYFLEALGYDRIDNPKLKALMRLRLSHEDASLEELSKLLSEELNTDISKSNVNHLFRSLDEEYRRAHNGKR
jgi:cell division protein WhiA